MNILHEISDVLDISCKMRPQNCLINSVYFPPKFSKYFMQDATSKLFFNPNFSKFSTAYSSVLSGYLVGRLTNQSYAIFATFAAYSFPALPNPLSCQTSGNVLNNA